MNRLVEGKRVFDVEIEALKKTRDSLGNDFLDIVDMITSCKGKLIITGMGKSGHIATKLAATFASLGTPSFYLHPGEAMHGDLGMITKEDLVLAISYSGESDEIITILPNIKMIGATLIGITGNPNSTLAKESDVAQILPKFDEACFLGLAPTSSTTAVLCYGDALAIVCSGIYGFKESDFGKFHPAGSLGKKLILKVDDIMKQNEDNPIVNEAATLKEAVIELSKKGLGIVSVVDNDNNLIGVITDGDLRRQLEKEVNIYELSVKDIMTGNPFTVQEGVFAVNALKSLKENNISALPVLKGTKIVGTIRIQDIINVGIIG